MTYETEKGHSEGGGHLESCSGSSGSARNTDTANSPVDAKDAAELSSLSLEGVFPKDTFLRYVGGGSGDMDVQDHHTGTGTTTE